MFTLPDDKKVTDMVV